MLEHSHDALRHLEKDMADIMEVLQDNNTTEIILNPYKKANGVMVGHILVQQHGKGLNNLLRYSASTINSEQVNIGDHIVFKYLTSNTDSIEFWVNLKCSLSDDLKQIALCLKNYFTPDAICQIIDPVLLDYAEMIEAGELPESPILPPNSIMFVVELLNQHLPSNTSFKLGYTVIKTHADTQKFKPYPTKLIKTELVKMSSTKAETIMSVLASINGKFIHQKSPSLECQIPKYGHRFTGVIPPVVAFPAFCIRKHAPKIFSLADFVVSGIMQQSSYDTILNWITRKFNILIAGGTGSGKTTLANAILYEISKLFPDTRVLIIEDVPELKFNTARSIGFTVGEFFSMYDALRTTLRFKPDRIVMGEVRGAEAYTLLKAWNTGHPGGIATIHANGVNEALYRFESCVCDHPEVKVNRQEVGFTINGIISIQNITLREDINGEYQNVVKRKVTALRQILQYDIDKDIYQDIVYDQLDFDRIN
jgi:type IV secretion system protein VirB11